MKTIHVSFAVLYNLSLPVFFLLRCHISNEALHSLRGIKRKTVFIQMKTFTLSTAARTTGRTP